MAALDELAPTLAAWKLVRVGDREMVEAVVRPEHRGPSPALRAALGRWRGTHYFTDSRREGLVLVRPLAEPAPRRWLLHLVLGVVTVACALGAGAMLVGAWEPPRVAVRLGPLIGGLVSGWQFLEGVARGGWREILPGAPFAVASLGILLVHEFGHYFAARRYAIDTSLPFLIPVPPTLSPVGSFGAFIRLRSPVLDRRQLLDVGAAGPLAGFVVAVAVLAWGYPQSSVVPGAGTGAAGDFVIFAGQQIHLGDSLLTRACRALFFPGSGGVFLSLPAFAGWVGAFVTGLNLLPLSQLDGGHVAYALLGRGQRWVARGAGLGLAVLGWWWSGWWVWAVLALAVGGGSWAHPPVVASGHPVPARRRWIGWACAGVFAVTFVPLPFRF